MRALDWLRLVILSVLWGATFFLVAIALREVPPLTLVLARCVIAALVLVPIVVLLGYHVPRTRMDWRNFLVMSMLNNIIPFGMIFYAQQAVPSGIAAVLNATTPLMSLLVLRVLAGEAMTPNKIAGVLIGLGGVGVLVSPTVGDSQSTTSALAMLAILGATLSYGLSGLWGRRFKAIPPPVTASAQMLCSCLLMLPIAAISDRFWMLPVPSTHVLLAGLALGVFSTALAYILFFQVMASAGPLNVMLVTLLIPFTTIALGALYLGEAMTPRQIAGAITIGVSLLVIDGRMFQRRAAA